MPRVHRVASLLKRWLLGTHQGAVRPQQLDHYLDEFTFRFNRRGSNHRGSNHRGLLFYRLVEQEKWRRRESNPRPQPHRLSVYKRRLPLRFARRAEDSRPPDGLAILWCRAPGDWLSLGAEPVRWRRLRATGPTRRGVAD